MPAKVKKKRGAPKGNQNARKHGLYSKVLDEAEQLDDITLVIIGVDQMAEDKHSAAEPKVRSEKIKA